MYTKGPWKIKVMCGQEPILHITTETDESICHLTECMNDRDTAHLIAASPDLLKALEAIDQFYVFIESNIRPGTGFGVREALNQARTAIAKARKT